MLPPTQQIVVEGQPTGKLRRSPRHWRRLSPGPLSTLVFSRHSSRSSSILGTALPELVSKWTTGLAAEPVDMMPQTLQEVILSPKRTKEAGERRWRARTES